MPASLAACSGAGHGRRVGRRDRDAVDALGDQILHDLHLLVAAAMLAGADIHALERAVRFRLGLLAAVAGLVEERVVHVLRHQREDELRLSAGMANEPSSPPKATAVRQKSAFFIVCLLPGLTFSLIAAVNRS